jgi:hypothetical protein
LQQKTTAKRALFEQTKWQEKLKKVRVFLLQIDGRFFVQKNEENIMPCSTWKSFFSPKKYTELGNTIPFMSLGKMLSVRSSFSGRCFHGKGSKTLSLSPEFDTK